MAPRLNNYILALVVVLMALMAMANAEAPKNATAPAPAPKKKPVGNIIVQGSIFCKAGNKTMPGAKAKLKCEGQANGKKPQSIVVVSNPTDSKGVYVIGVPATLPSGEKLLHCKVFLNSPSVPTCKVPTNINGGIKGFGLTKVMRTTNPHDKLFFVPPFYYAPK